jgi:hypothetical protein
MPKLAFDMAHGIHYLVIGAGVSVAFPTKTARFGPTATGHPVWLNVEIEQACAACNTRPLRAASRSFFFRRLVRGRAAVLDSILVFAQKMAPKVTLALLSADDARPTTPKRSSSDVSRPGPQLLHLARRLRHR